MTERETHWFTVADLLGEAEKETARLPWSKPKPNEIVIDGETRPNVQVHVGGFTPDEMAAVTRARRR
jgi:hypothetical protein